MLAFQGSVQKFAVQLTDQHSSENQDLCYQICQGRKFSFKSEVVFANPAVQTVVLSQVKYLARQ